MASWLSSTGCRAPLLVHKRRLSGFRFSGQITSVLDMTIDVTDDWAVKLNLGIIALETRIPESATMRGLERDEVDFSHDQRFGPLTPWVVANARAMLALEELDVLAVRLEQAAMAVNPKVNEVALSIVAGMADRDEAVARVGRTAYRLTRRVTAREDWKGIVRERADEIGRSRNWTRTYLGDLLGEFIGNTLVACALQDLMNDSLTMSATGAWCSILSPHEDFPGERWRCSDSTTAILRRFFADLDEDGLVDRIMAIDDPRNTEESQQCVKLIGSTLLRNASPPPLAEIVGPGLRDLLPYRGARSLMDQLARLIAGLAQPPDTIEPADVARLRCTMTETLGVVW